MATNFRVKISKIGRLISIRRPDIPNRLQYRHYNFLKVICDNMAIVCVNLVNFGI